MEATTTTATMNATRTQRQRRKARAHGEGSLYVERATGMWVAAVDLGIVNGAQSGSACASPHSKRHARR